MCQVSIMHQRSGIQGLHEVDFATPPYMYTIVWAMKLIIEMEEIDFLLMIPLG